MRLWSLHPRYLDPKGLVALWREALARPGRAPGAIPGDIATIPSCSDSARSPLRVAASPSTFGPCTRNRSSEATASTGARLCTGGTVARVDVTRGQLDFEWRHLLAKLEKRNPPVLEALQNTGDPAPHPLFRVVPGAIEEWERP